MHRYLIWFNMNIAHICWWYLHKQPAQSMATRWYTNQVWSSKILELFISRQSFATELCVCSRSPTGITGKNNTHAHAHKTGGSGRAVRSSATQSNVRQLSYVGPGRGLCVFVRVLCCLLTGRRFCVVHAGCSTQTHILFSLVGKAATRSVARL